MQTTTIHLVAQIIGRGIGQVMFQNSAVAGWLMLTGIFLSSWQMGLLAIGGNIVSTLAAWLSGYKREDIENGLYGFNGTLVGIAAGAFMALSAESLLLTMLAAALSTFLARLFNRYSPLPGFTAPFILAVWILLGGCALLAPDMLLPAAEDTAAKAPPFHFFQAFCLGIGQVMFQGETVLAGLFFLAGILIHSRMAALYTAMGALLPLPVAMLLGADIDSLNAGLMGYNGVLCAIALGGVDRKSVLWAGCAVVLSVALQLAGMHWGVTTLTAPFVVSVWIVLLVQRMRRQEKKSAD